MTMTAKKQARDMPVLESGRVAATGPGLRVTLGYETFPAARAKSCLVAPQEGDRVLCAIEPDVVYVLAVLEGTDEKTTKLSVEGSLEIAASGGRVTVTSSEGVDIAGPELRMEANKGAVFVGEMGFVGRLLRADVGKATLVVRELESFCTRALSYAKQALRVVEGQDSVRAGSVELRAEKSIAMHGESCLVGVRGLAKINGEQVQLG
jgi:hypothetical protein